MSKASVLRKKRKQGDDVCLLIPLFKVDVGVRPIGCVTAAGELEKTQNQEQARKRAE